MGEIIETVPSRQIATAPAMQPSARVPQVSEDAALIHVITKAALDPSFDLGRLQSLIEMKERMQARAAEVAFDAAMSDAQSEMRPVAADSNNPQTRSKYASYAALDRAIRPIYTKHGFSLTFDTGDCPLELHVRVLCRASHRGGHNRGYHIDMPADGKGAKGGDVMTKTHATGSAISYGMRYLLKMIFNLSVGEDDDGNKAGTASDRITDDQAMAIRDLLESVEAPEAKFLEWAKAERITDIPAAHYASCVDAIRSFKKVARS
jgi:ERF superfamily